MSNRSRLSAVKFNPWTKHKKERGWVGGWEVAGGGGASNPSQRHQQSLGVKAGLCQRACQWRQTRTRGTLENAEHHLSLVSLFTAVFHSLCCRPEPCQQLITCHQCAMVVGGLRTFVLFCYFLNVCFWCRTSRSLCILATFYFPTGWIQAMTCDTHLTKVWQHQN